MLDLNNKSVDTSEAMTFAHPLHVTSRANTWRRLLAEFVGTFFLILVAAGSGVVGTTYPGSVPLESAAAAASLIVLVLVLSLGRISGAYFNAVGASCTSVRNALDPQTPG